MIKLPSYNMFVAKSDGKYALNSMTGSAGTDPLCGCLHKYTFNYKVAAIKPDNDSTPKILMAECWLISPWKLGGKKQKLACKEFECTEQGIKEAEKWLNIISEKVLEKTEE